MTPSPRRSAVRTSLATLALAAVAAASDGPPLPVQLCAVPSSVEDAGVADLDGDGLLDLVVLSRTDPFASTFLGVGGGALSPRAVQEVQTFVDPRAFALGDVDGDLVPDLVVACENATAVHQGVGDGTFAAPYGLPPAGGADLLLHDLDGDGDLDLAITNTGEGVVVVGAGDGAGAFGPFANHVTAAGPTEVRAALLDGDAVPDLAVAAVTSGRVSILLGDGSLGYVAVAPLVATGSLTDLELGDVDGDGAQDVVVSQAGIGVDDLLVWEGVGDGTFGAPSSPLGTGGAGCVALGDLEGDGDLDFVVPGTAPSVVRQQPPFGFDPPQPIYQGSFSASPEEDFLLADLDGNGFLDIIGSNGNFPLAGVFLAADDGTYPVWNRVVVQGVEYDLAIGDLDGDGRPDVGLDSTFAPGSTDALWTLPGAGDGTFGAETLTVVDTNADGSPRRVAFARVDGDAHLDALVQDSTGDRVLFLAGAGDGTFAPQVAVPTYFDPYHMIAADVDGDGATDVVTAHDLWDRVAVVRGHGDGTFDAPLVASVGDGPTDVAVGDLDGDGALDAVTSDSDGETISVLLGVGDGTFAPAVTYGATGDPTSVEIADLGDDGVLDVVVGHDSSGTSGVVVYPGLGDGTLGVAVWYPTDGRVEDLRVADMDDDGLLDVVAMASPSGLAWLRGTGGTALATPQLHLGVVARAFDVADLDGDYAPEVLFTSGGVEVLVNRRPTAWRDLRGASPGLEGLPALVPDGSLAAGGPLDLALTSAPSGALLLAWLSLGPVPFPALGGTVHAFPFVSQFPRSADTAGTWGESAVWPAGIPSGTDLWLQFIVQDVSVPAGLTLSNGVRGTTP